MEKKILVPITLQKDARLANVDVDFELEISCSFSQQSAPAVAPSPPPPVARASSNRLFPDLVAPPPPVVQAPPPPEPPQQVKPTPRPPASDERTTALATPEIQRELAKPMAATTKLPVVEPPKAKSASGGIKTKIDNVLDELLKKKAPKK